MKIVKKIIKGLIYTLMIAILSFNLFNFVSRNILKKELPTIGGYAILEVVSGSMEPTIHVGDLVIIDTTNKSYKESQIVTFKDVNGSFVTHRIKELNEDYAITQGDANNTTDGNIEINSIVGTYVTKINKVGTIFNSLKSPLVMILIFAIGVVVCAIVSSEKDAELIDVGENDEEYLEYKRKKEEESKKK